MPDVEAVEEQSRLYSSANISEDLDAKYPNRPQNIHKTLPFHDLFIELFNPLLDSTKRNKPAGGRRKVGPHGASNLSPHEARRNIIQRFIGKWRNEVGQDFYPALRLIIPEKDRDRAMYGLKEKAIAKLLIRVLKINKDSEDAKSLVNWKLPGQLKGYSSAAGDFAERCFNVLSKRPLLTQPGKMTIAEVNEHLDKLSMASREEDQLPIFQRFYRRMCPEEMTWLIRIILRQMKIGATEKTILEIWHPDAETLFNVSSNLRRVCWELYDPKVRLDGGDSGITLMECFQPQLAAFQAKFKSFDSMVGRLKQTPDDDSFWIEEKLDGERIQLHMTEDPSTPGGKRFGFWSRKAKDYAYLYGTSFDNNEPNALTRFIKDAFDPSVRNIILDGEMITWDMDIDHIVGFGTLKSAAISEKENRNGSNTGQRPVFRVFDCVYLNDTVLTPYTLRDRRRALSKAVKDVYRRLEILPYYEAHNPNEIEPRLRQVIAEASEGLVLKNPRSAYRLNDRNDDWIKVKPEYMSEFGESLDCIVVGAYFGSGHRGGAHSSFLCGLLVDKNAEAGDEDYERCYSFFKVGGGMSREDYVSIKQRTEGKWRDWDARTPPSIIELGGHKDNRQYFKPDQWIKPSDSVVLEVKAASVETSDKYRMNITLRFPRFKALRDDKGWRDALSIKEFMSLKDDVERKHDEKEREFKIEQSRRTKRVRTKKTLTVQGNEPGEKNVAKYAGPQTRLFDGLRFYIMTDALHPQKTCKADLDALVKSHGGAIVQRESKPAESNDLVIIADKRLVKVQSLEKRGEHNIIRPAWLYDCIHQAEIDIDALPLVLPWEPNRHMFFLKEEDQLDIERHLDEYGDSFARDIVEIEELREIFGYMGRMPKFHDGFSEDEDRKSQVFGGRTSFLEQAEEHGLDLSHLKNLMFSNVVAYFDMPNNDGITTPHLPFRSQLASNMIRFGGGDVVGSVQDDRITHVVLADEGVEERKERLKWVAENMMELERVPRRVGVEWVEKCWEEGTRLDEERFGGL
ncbi:ATP-dependent DNA ligase [Delitschia confertaspora ATCC 74209]|uniref:DNA ligase n=1 Tax=Delitschia confertaspora ATCC 74209 TaxID=1513339 RepID=A0A9P4MPS6_9PLEO|nr:ATP-dependent DNA ligase [Delitschia confertaspora ATCC 74209]